MTIDMKKTALILCAAMLPGIYGINTAAAQERIDTVAAIEKPHKVMIYETAKGGVELTVNGRDSQNDFYYTYSSQISTDTVADDIEYRLPFIAKKKKRTDKVWTEWDAQVGLHYGFVSMSGAPSGTGKMSESAELGFLNPLSFSVHIPRLFSIDTGLGFGWKNYRLSEENRFNIDDNGQVVITGYEAGQYHRLSRLKLFYLDIPVLLHKNFGRFAIKAGAVVNFNVHSSILTRYRMENEDNAEYKKVVKGVGQRKVTFDLMAAAGFDGIGLYVKYSPMTVLKSSAAPEFKSLSVGFIAGF